MNSKQKIYVIVMVDTKLNQISFLRTEIINLWKNDYFSCTWMSVLPMCMYVHHTNAWLLRKPEEGLDDLELELKRTIGHDVDSRNGICALCERILIAYPTLQPLLIFKFVNENFC